MDEGADDLFARWEADVATQELHAQSGGFEVDPLSEAFDAVEQQEALRQALTEIISSPFEKTEVSNE